MDGIFAAARRAVIFGFMFSAVLAAGVAGLPAHQAVAATYKANGKTVVSNYNEFGYMPWVKTNGRASKGLAAAAGIAAPVKKKSKLVKVAALNKESFSAADPSAPQTPGKSITSGSVTWVASASCLDATLRSVIEQIAATYGPVRVNSTCRSHAHNRSVGGARKSWHLRGRAADIRVFGNVGATYAYLRSSPVGGLKHYGGGLFHIDMGPRRSW